MIAYSDKVRSNYSGDIELILLKTHYCTYHLYRECIKADQLVHRNASKPTDRQRQTYILPTMAID